MIQSKARNILRTEPTRRFKAYIFSFVAQLLRQVNVASFDSVKGEFVFHLSIEWLNRGQIIKMGKCDVICKETRKSKYRTVEESFEFWFNKQLRELHASTDSTSLSLSDQCFI